MRHLRPGVALASVAAIGAVWTVVLVAAPSKTDEILARAGVYLGDFVQRFSNIVAEEQFVQDARRLTTSAGKSRGKELAALGATIHRELISDYLLVRTPGLDEWQTFRDVVQVDGRPVGERNQRLTQLFLEPSNGAVARALEIERDGARYNLGDSARTINNPLLALAFLQTRYQPRFRFSLREADPDVGPDVWIVEYKEQARPTVLRRAPDGNLPARGRFWIERRTGRVVKTELTVSDDDAITTSFRFDERFQIALPVEMQESYWYGNDYVVGLARYGRFRQFAVQTEEKIDTERIK